MNFVNTAKDIAMRGRYFVKAKSPELLLVGALISGGLCIYSTIKGTIKAAPVVEEAKNKLDAIDFKESEAYEDWKNRSEAVEDENEPNGDNDNISRRQIIGGTIIKVSKCFIPAVTFGICTVGCVLASYKIVNGRLVGATVAYEGATAAFAKYRKKVREKFGEEVDKELFYGNNVKKVEKVDEKTGEVTEEYIPSVDDDCPFACSPYSFIRENESYHPGFDLMQVTADESYWNDMLNARGYIEANSIYESMPGHKGEHKGSWCGVGWLSKKWIERLKDIGVLDDNYPGDGYISFGVLGDNEGGPQAAAWRDGVSKAVMIDLNVDGPIYKFIDAINNYDDLVAKKVGK